VFLLRPILCIALVVSRCYGACELTEAIDRLAQEEIESKRAAGLTIAIDKDGKTILAKGYCFADLEHQVPATVDTVHRIGSVTKQFTAAAIVQLLAAGKLRLEDEVHAVLPEYPAPPKPITIRNFLQHTSGIPHFNDLPSYAPNVRNDVTPAKMIARAGLSS
jgi:CubicO group peptidase (beta-lactamase class C family)